ncbi:MAG: hypothetical protein ACI84C_001195 [Flavobacteriales bacterium]|jgi:hypothetical protein
MIVAPLKDLKKELSYLSTEELREVCLRISKHKKENKELLSYLLFHASNETEFIEIVKSEIDEQFETINRKTTYFIKKNIRKILAGTKKHIRYSKIKTTEIELLIHFCKKLREFTPSIKRNKALFDLYERQRLLIENAVNKLEEDLQFDYKEELEILTEF